MNDHNDFSGDLPLTYTHTFVLKIWLEKTAEEDENPIWRGSIIHVGNGVRKYVKKLDEFSSYIVPYLKEMGVRVE